MASGFTRPNERISNADVAKLATGGKLAHPTITDYAKTGKNIVQAASGSKVVKR
jgi:hypothetical protein